jgi:hypothetical protein
MRNVILFGFGNEEKCAQKCISTAVRITGIPVTEAYLQTSVLKKKAVFWDVALCRCGVNRRFRGTDHLHHIPHPRKLLSS